MEDTFTNTVCSIAFVVGLATVGLFSHTQQPGSANIQDLINGSLQQKYENGFKAANPLKATAIAAMGSVKYVVFRQAAKGMIVGADGWLFTTEELETNTTFGANIIASADKITAVAHKMAQRDVHLLPVIIPDKAEIYAEYLNFNRSSLITGRRDALISVLSQHGIVPLDSTQALLDAKTQGNVFMADDTHWSPTGSQAVANAIGAAIGGYDFIRTNVTTVQLGTVNFDGDLLAYVPTGTLRSWVGPKQNAIDTFVTTVTAGDSLFGDTVIDVVLVGTSFSAKTDWHFEGFLKQALQTDVLNFADECQGPFAPMEAFLASDTFQNNTPKIVIWEIPVRYTSKEYKK